jgi:DNA modification methylase
MNKILTGDSTSILKTLPEESVQCICTSPPYFGLRDYGNAEQIGLEETPEEYVEKLVTLFREARRVLRKDGTLWLNLGDSYAGGGKGGGGSAKQKSNKGSLLKPIKIKTEYKHKDLIGIPWMVAFALRADGWYLRQDIVWNKNNSMPESVTDRCTKSHEYIFLLTKSKDYYFDNYAIREPAAYDGRKDTMFHGGVKYDQKSIVPGQPNNTMQSKGHERWKVDENGERMRNKRSVWLINNEPYEGSHFATYPTLLVETCIKAGTSERGCCAKCGAPYERVLKKIGESDYGEIDVNNKKRLVTPGSEITSKTSVFRTGKSNINATVGWKATCECNAGEPVPCMVMDVFAGSGTTGFVAVELNREYTLIELNPEYVKLAEERIKIAKKPMIPEVRLLEL